MSKTSRVLDRLLCAGLGTLLDRVLPSGCRIVEAAAVPAARRFAIIRAHYGPRWILPLQWECAEPVVRQWTPFDLLSRVIWSATTLAHRHGRLGLSPGTVTFGVTGGDWADWSKLGAGAPLPATPIFQIGRPTPMQKAAVALVRQDRGVDRLVKVAMGPSAWPFVEREHRQLQQLEALRSDVAPAPLGLFPDRQMMAQSWVEGRMELHWEIKALREFLRRFERPRPTSLAAVAARYHDRLQRLEHSTTRDLLLRLVEGVRCATAVPETYFHGDFAKWNLIRGRDDAIRAVDWEYADPDGAPLLDLFHHLLADTFWFSRKPSLRAAGHIALEREASTIAPDLDRLGAPWCYAEEALKLYFVILFTTRHNAEWQGETLSPALARFAASFESSR